MFAQHNGQVCFLSLCASAAIVAEEDVAVPAVLAIVLRHSPSVGILLSLYSICRPQRNRNRSQRQIPGHNHIEWQIIEVSLAIDLWEIRCTTRKRRGQWCLREREREGRVRTTRQCQTRSRAHEQSRAECWWVVQWVEPPQTTRAGVESWDTLETIYYEV